MFFQSYLKIVSQKTFKKNGNGQKEIQKPDYLRIFTVRPPFNFTLFF